jgi:hypothetical protein
MRSLLAKFDPCREVNLGEWAFILLLVYVTVVAPLLFVFGG